MSDQNQTTPPLPCDDCIADDGPAPDHQPVTPVSRRQLLRDHGLKGLALVVGGALAVKAHEARAGYVYWGRGYKNVCFKTCTAHQYICDMYRNEFGQVYYTNCTYVTDVNTNCTAWAGKPYCCCSSCYPCNY